MPGPRQLAEMFRNAPKRVERNIYINPDDQALFELRRTPLLRIAHLER
jgi:hypothetical protein